MRFAKASLRVGHRARCVRRGGAVIDRSAAMIRRSDRGARASAPRHYVKRTIAQAMQRLVERIRPPAQRNRTLGENKRTTTEAILTWPVSIRTRACASATHRRGGVQLVV
jgi:hypothetical protein